MTGECLPQGCIRRGGGGWWGLKGGRGRGVWLRPPPSLGPPMVPAEGGRRRLSLNPVGTEGAKAKFWLSATTLEAEEGGGSREGGHPPSFCGVRPF